MILDVYGIPGCGKTYYLTILKRKLKSEGKLFLDISRFKGMPFWLKICYKLADYLILLLPKYRCQRRELIDLFASKKKKSKYVPLPLLYCVNDIVLSNMIHDVLNKSERLYLNDEGQIQRYIFLMTQFECSKGDLLNVYGKYRTDSISIYLETDVDTAFSNIKKRNRHVCPMDELCNSSLISYLSEFHEGCELFKKETNSRYVYNVDEIKVYCNKPLTFI